jgi:hypothetical protein
VGNRVVGRSERMPISRRGRSRRGRDCLSPARACLTFNILLALTVGRAGEPTVHPLNGRVQRLLPTWLSLARLALPPATRAAQEGTFEPRDACLGRTTSAGGPADWRGYGRATAPRGAQPQWARRLLSRTSFLFMRVECDSVLNPV